jgi:hypothetical protein
MEALEDGLASLFPPERAIPLPKGGIDGTGP